MSDNHQLAEQTPGLVRWTMQRAWTMVKVIVQGIIAIVVGKPQAEAARTWAEARRIDAEARRIDAEAMKIRAESLCMLASTFPPDVVREVISKTKPP